MVGHAALDRRIGVRVPASQPIQIPASNSFGFSSFRGLARRKAGGNGASPDGATVTHASHPSPRAVRRAFGARPIGIDLQLGEHFLRNQNPVVELLQKGQAVGRSERARSADRHRPRSDCSTRDLDLAGQLVLRIAHGRNPGLAQHLKKPLHWKLRQLSRLRERSLPGLEEMQCQEAR